MFAKSTIETTLEKEIETQLNKLSQSTDAAEYSAIVDRVAKLHKLKSEESTATLSRETAEHKAATESRIKPPSLDNVLIVSANLFGIFWLTRYEKEHALSSKALGFVMRPR